MEDASAHSDKDDPQRYLIFRLGDEIFATRLAEIREIVQPGSMRDVPNTIPSFRGITNLRGEVVGVIDLRRHFGLATNPSPREALLVFNTDQGLLAALVDQAERVAMIRPSGIAKNGNLLTRVPQKYLIGVATTGQQLVIVVNLHMILEKEELTTVLKSTAAA